MNYQRLPKLLLGLLFMVITVAASAQERTVTGKVTDQQTGLPMQGVSVKVKNSDVGTSTNIDGDYTIRVPSSESILVFTYVGYLMYELKVGTTPTVDIKLTVIEKSLEDVVVVGYGTKKRVNVQGAVSSIKGSEIEDIPVANLPSSLVNRVPGVGVNFSSGKPGSTTTINIRNSSVFGAAGLDGITTQPLIVIDGIISNPTQWAQASGADFFENLDASQIEDITFLKDASAAIYGAAGAKGVILITTKKGKAGKPKISYSGYFGVSDEAVKAQTLTAYEHAKFLNDGFELNGTASNQRFSQADLDSLRGVEDKAWFDHFWKAGKVNRHTINVSGGTDKITLFAGGSYYNETGNYGNIEVNKYSLRTGMNATIVEGFTATVSFASDFNREQSNNHKSAQVENDDATIRPLYLTPKWVPFMADGIPVGFQGANNSSPQNQNWSLLGVHRSGSYRDSKSPGLSINASLEWKPKLVKGLTARVQYGKNNRTQNVKGYYAPYFVGNFIRRGQNGLLYSNAINPASPTVRITNNDEIEEGITSSENYQFITTLSYARKIKQHDIDVMVGFDQSEAESRNVLLSKSTQLVAGVDEFWAFSNDPSTLGSVQDALRNPQVFLNAKRSYLSRVNYSFLGKYFFEFIGRADASMNFAPENRWGFFPTVGVGWKISDEDFFNNIAFVNTLKLRANYGLVGEDRVGNRLWESRFTQTTGILFGSVAGGGLDPNIYPNPGITWEKARTFNIGFDASILRNKISITAEYYQRYSYDGYDRYAANVFPPTTGIPPPVINYAEHLSWGTEFAIGYRTRFGKDWSFGVDANFAFTNSQLMNAFYNESILGNYGNDQLNILVGRDPRTYNGNNVGYIAKGILRTQAEVDAILAKNPNYLIGGVKPQVGFMDFVDVNGDGQITEAGDATLMFDKTTPLTVFGFTFNVSYKEFKLQTNMNLSVGGKRFYDSEARKVPTTTQNAPKFWADHWSPENPNGKFPRADAPLLTANSTFWAVNGTQSRINNAVLSYQLPKKLAAKFRIPDLRVMVTGTNLINIINPLKYKDPYTSNFANYPTLRTISFGVNASL